MMQYKKKVQSLILAAMLAPLANGCGFIEGPALSNQLFGLDGRVITVADIEEIIFDPELVGNEEETRQRLRDLGIEDEKLIDALLTL